MLGTAAVLSGMPSSGHRRAGHRRGLHPPGHGGHDFTEKELELKLNSQLTREIVRLTTQSHTVPDHCRVSNTPRLTHQLTISAEDSARNTRPGWAQEPPLRQPGHAIDNFHWPKSPRELDPKCARGSTTGLSLVVIAPDS